MSRKKPIEILKREGPYRKDRHGNRMKLPPGTPEMPEHMSEAARATWEKVVVDLAGVICPVDQDALRNYCESVAQLDSLLAVWEQEPPVIEGTNGPVRNPFWSVLKETSLRVDRLGSRFNEGTTDADPRHCDPEGKPSCTNP